MPEIYSDCFIGLRLTQHDGNANTVQEFNAMNIPIIFNGPGGVKWKNALDIINIIKSFQTCEKENNIVEKENNIVEEEFDFYNNNFIIDDLKKIYKNIDNFVNQFNDKDNILFLCGDYPGYGGSATNCNKLQDFFISKNLNTLAIYFNYNGETNIKIDKNQKYEIVMQNDLLNVLSNLKFNPNVIILKSYVNIDLKKIFNCKTIFIIPGIFTNNLDKYYYTLENNEYEKYINKNTIEQIKKCDISYCNSSHTRNILLTKYNLKTNLFYSSFIAFYNFQQNKKKNLFSRKYDFGLVVSNFDRKIKNVDECINFLKDKHKVILIGNNSNIYENNKNFDCLELVDDKDIVNLYSKIKFIIQDSFFESCSNVKIEATMYGCNVVTKIITIDYNNLNQIIKIKKNNNYIIGNFTYFYDKLNLENVFIKNSFETYVINQNQTKELILFVNTDYDIEIKLIDLFQNINFKNIKIGYNVNQYKTNELINMYYLYGYNNIDKKTLGLNLFYDTYINSLNSENIHKTYNKDLFTLIFSYYNGNTNKNYDINKITEQINKFEYNKENVLIISKLIKGYGGVQKTSFQLIQTIDTKYNVLILSNLLKNNLYDFMIDELNDDIPNILIIRLNEQKEIENYINKNNFKYIINNKLEEILKFNFNKKINYLCHNSMDPFNNLIIKNNHKIDKLFTINNFHKNLMLNNSYNGNIYLYNNYVLDSNVKNCNSKIKNKFTYKIGFVGRLSKEKNIQLLIDSINYYNNLQIDKNKITLYIIGDGNIELENLNDNIILTGRLNFEEILIYYNEFDYIISSSLTEGKPFAIIEALSYGIPCMHSNINGINEIIFNDINGFTFDFINYEQIRYKMNFDNLNKIKNNDNVINIFNVLTKAYNIDINTWNKMSKNAINLCGKEYHKNFCIDKNLFILEINYDKKYVKKFKIFVNFKPNENVAYGGGNISVYYITRQLGNLYSDFDLTFELEENINVYLIIDPLKDNNFKKYSIEDIIEHRNKININGKIIIRVNDCDKTRIISNINLSRENKILLNHENIDYYIFNSNFIKSYYLNIFEQKNIKINNYCVITNGCDENIFYNETKIIDYDNNKKIRIVTHHWSNNINKGYETYYKLWKYTKDNINKNIEFVFIGKNVPDMFKEVPIIGPLVGNELSSELNNCHIYITDSRYDSCPNHVLEALSCGLPILYSNYEGGARELCMMSKYEVGEIYNNFEELIEKIDKIKNNYQYYIDNIKKSKYLYEIKYCVNKYYNIFIKNICNYSNKIELLYENNILNISCIKDDCYLFINELEFKLIKGDNIFALNKSTFEKIELHFCVNDNIQVKDIIISNQEFTKNNKKLNNDKINILLCSDNNYLVGLFATLHSVIINTNYIDNAHFNFMLPIEETNVFSKMLIEFELKLNISLSKSIIYLDKEILDKTILESKCYNGGGHLLNLGNLSRLMIGEFMEYPKLIYLDSDSIVQTDIIKKILNFNMDKDLYSSCANLYNSNNEKSIIIKMNAIINCDYDWTNLIGQKINKDDYVYMGAPFITNCLKWKSVYSKMIDIIKIHNNTDGGIYKLFTMSIQNILFYKNITNINCLLDTICDLGSTRKKWGIEDLIYRDIIDWSGIYKPWFKNGLYKNLFINHDIMNLSTKYGLVINKKNTIEQFDNNNTSENNKNIVDIKYLNITTELFNEFQKYIKNILNNSKTTINYNILYVCDASYLLKKMSRVRFWAIEELGKNPNVNLHLTGPGFLNFNSTKSLQQNILDMNIKFDIVIWYKPLNKNYNFDYNVVLPFKTCLRYNEMWDETLTIKEINESKTNIIICHHYNDYLKYKNIIYNNDETKQFYYNPHHANTNIFKQLNIEKNIDILISGVCSQKHYPLKYRLLNLINTHKNTTLSKYKIYTHSHPGYNNELNFKNVNQINYNEIINKSKLCIACTSSYNYRLGKYVEIPMAGSVIVGDLPFEDEKFKDFVVEVNMNMTDEQILSKIIDTLENPNIIIDKIHKGLEWSKKYTTQNYISNLFNIIKNKNKIFIISDEIRDDHPEFAGQKWICDILKQEFMNAFPLETTTNAKEANVIWYLAPWNYRYIPQGFKVDEWFEHLKTTNVIFTQHHIDEEKLNLGQLDKQFEFMKMYGNKFHAICNITKKNMKKYFDESLISSKKLWINDNKFFHIKHKVELRKKYNFNKKAFLIGSFQKDTEGKSNLPKLSKGPDIFVNIVKDMFKSNPDIEIVLTGLRREYIINELKKVGIKYHYFNMVSLEEINELYNCLDLYIVSSRCEGGPRAVFEAGITKTPIISTRVGIAPELMARSSLFNVENWTSYRSTKPNVELLYNNIKKISSYDYMEEFKNYLIK
jgi:glycosyltransferase involved in cell wall biosynthesis